MRLLPICAVVALLPAVTGAATIEKGPGDDIEAAMNALQPGDELVLRGGLYELSGRFGVSLLGTQAQPIVVRAKDGETPHLHRALADQNIVDIDDAQWATIRGLEFSGGSAGIRISGATHLTIEGCEIHDPGDVAVRANDTGVVYDSLVIRKNHIHHTNDTGEGMYLGCNSNGCQVKNSLIEGNYIHHTNQASVLQGDGIELKEGSFGNVIRDNVIHDTNYPCILSYSAAGNGPANVIERNVLWNCGDHGIQSAADAIIRNNLILGAVADGISMQPHQAGAPSNLVVVHNTVLNGGDALALRGTTGSVVIANNALYSQSGRGLYVSGGSLSQVIVSKNVGTGGIVGFTGGFSAGTLTADFVSAHHNGSPPIDLFPKAGGALIAAGDALYVTTDDFNGTPRDNVADVGAYRFDAGGNPGWILTAGFKSATPSPGGNDGGTGISDAGLDAGQLPDSGLPSTADAGPSDAGSSGTNSDETAQGGCGCGETGSSLFVFALALLLTVFRRPAST